MELTPYEQIVKLINEKENILLVTHVKPDGDALSSILSIFILLEKMGKGNIYAACADKVPESFNFLPSTKKLKQKDIFPNDFIVSLDCSEISVERLRWYTKDGKLDIVISPKNGNFKPNNVTFSERQDKFDLIIAVDVSDREQLGNLFFKNTELFSSTPIINIDHHISNTNFGNINLIDATASSTTEVIFALLPYLEKAAGKKLMDENIATLLLTGIITDTGSFQNPNTTPKSFEIAADLIEAGAKQQEIIRRLFKTKSLSTLKLWGRVLSRIKNDPIHRFVWSTVSITDLEKTGSTSDDLAGILDDLLSNAPGAEVVMLLKEREDGIISGSIRTTSNAIDATKIAGLFGGGGHKQAAGFKIPKKERSFESITDEVISKIKEYQSERLGIREEDKTAAKQPKKIEANEKKLPTKEKVIEFGNKKEDKKTIDINAGIKPKIDNKVTVDVKKNNKPRPKKKVNHQKKAEYNAKKTKEANEIFEKAKSELSKEFSPEELKKKVGKKKGK